MRTSPVGSDAGFTLTELLVVLAIMALVVSVTPALYLTVVPGARVKSASVDLVSYLRQARLDAARTGMPVILEVSERTIRPNDGKGKSFEAPNGTKLAYRPTFDAENDAPELVFFPGGGSSGGMVRLVQGDAERSLSINWLTGQIVMDP